jgi:hypothetical protein
MEYLSLTLLALVLSAPSVHARPQGGGGPIVNGSVGTPGPRAQRTAPRLGLGTMAQYYFHGVGSGTLGSQVFGDAAFTILLTADTSDICQCTSSTVFEVEGPSRISIQGIDSAEFTIPTRVFSNVSVAAVGFSRALPLDLRDFFGMREPEFAGYALGTSIGPIFEPEPSAVNQFVNVPTSQGLLTFSSIEHVLFAAIVGGEPACFTLDFQTEDDLATPLANGQHLDTEFGLLATLTSGGPNAGLAIFDSSPLGPNDPSQDRDLLVGTGHVLVLQTENFPPDADDVFPRPNDDSDGGTIAFELATEMEATSLRLIDIDGTDGTSRVVLTDSSARQRTYTVPGNWTGDRLVAGPGHGLLDLATLAPQPGFASVATAVEQAGFDPLAVVRLEVELAGSGAIDDLALCARNLPRASVEVRNGRGINGVRLSTAARPVLGSTWSASLDCTGFGSGLAVLSVRRGATEGSVSTLGELLIRGAPLHSVAVVHSGSVQPLRWSIPLDLSLWGLEAHAQALCRGSVGGGPKPSARAALSNALDLVLGF